MKTKEVLHIYIGETDIQEWTQGVGKDILMPQMFESVKEMLSTGKSKIQFARVEASIRDKKQAFDFFVEYEGVWDTLEKLMEWALDEEKYEICAEIRKIEEELDKDNEF
tara:strand:+ start:501 stop:827 length:327 start_codon:yes stop_codon:yes gene_type:complete